MSMNDEEARTGRGESPVGFSQAAREAVEHYEEKYGKPQDDEVWTLKVLEQYVTVENPVRDYIVIVGPGG
jgi:hypothetical protein